MKRHLLLATLLIASTAHSAVLKIDCTFKDPEVKDHVLIELLTEQRGTFYYKADSDDVTGSTPTDKLELKRVASSQGDVAKWRVTHDEVGLYFLMPLNLVMKPSDSFKGSLVTEIPELQLSNEQEMKCSSKN